MDVHCYILFRKKSVLIPESGRLPGLQFALLPEKDHNTILVDKIKSYKNINLNTINIELYNNYAFTKDTIKLVKRLAGAKIDSYGMYKHEVDISNISKEC